MLYDQTTVVDVTLDQAAVSKMNDLVYQDPRNECGGFLIGRGGPGRVGRHLHGAGLRCLLRTPARQPRRLYLHQRLSDPGPALDRP